MYFPWSSVKCSQLIFVLFFRWKQVELIIRFGRNLWRKRCNVRFICMKCRAALLGRTHRPIAHWSRSAQIYSHPLHSEWTNILIKLSVIFLYTKAKNRSQYSSGATTAFMFDSSVLIPVSSLLEDFRNLFRIEIYVWKFWRLSKKVWLFWWLWL